MLATAIPQGDPTQHNVEEWAAANAAVEPIVGALGLHGAFGAPVFIVVTVMLGISTMVCSWGRTKLALSRARQLDQARDAGTVQIAESSDFDVLLPEALSDDDVFDCTQETLADLGIRATRDDGTLRAVSPAWSVWGSAVFHWSLVVLVLAVFAGILLRAEGSMAVPVGDAKPDQEASYLSVKTGPWHNWARVARSIRVDDFDPAVTRGDLEIGAVPTVSVVDEQGRAVVTQQVYPNKKLHAGSLSLYAPECGLSVTLAFIGSNGEERTRVKQLVEFSQEASGGTVPVEPLMARDNSGRVLMRLSATIPLDPDTVRGGYGEWIPKEPRAYVSLVDGSGATLYEGEVTKDRPGPIAGGGEVRLVDIGWFSFLTLVDDPSIPFIYASMIAAMLGLTLSVATRQQLFIATIVDRPEGRSLAVRMRLWRNVPATRDEVREALAGALLPDEERTAS